MFPREVYIERRRILKNMVKKGIMLLLGNREVPMNYMANPYPFRQDSTYLYYFGIDLPGIAAIIDAETGDEILYGNDVSMEDIIWMGEQEKLKDKAEKAGIKRVKPMERLDADICKAIARNRQVHFLPAYSEQRRLLLSYYNNIKYEEIDQHVSVEFVQAVIKQRSIKDDLEVEEMERTMTNVTYEAYMKSAGSILPGNSEYHVAGSLEGSILQNNCRMAYPLICSVRGEILHNHFHGNEMKKGQLLLVDAGAESEMHYATDITRTFPVGGKFLQHQRDIYNIVLNAQVEAVSSIKPGLPFRDIHFKAAEIITEGLKDMGLLKGKPEDAVQLGVHTLFFPHGLGHMIGLDVHDMEDLGEDNVGYDREFLRSEQFGTAYLRMAKRLKEGNVVTVEPGIYFIGELIDKWKGERRFADFINYDAVDKFRNFGGIRIEDNVAVTVNGYRLIGRHIPKDPDELEHLLSDL